MAKVISVVGPTASGKTALSVALAKHFNGQVISLDSMQIYRGMNIGTAKISWDEQDGVVHHMIDILDPSQNYSVKQFVSRAREIADGLLANGVDVILAGGTGLYLDHLLSDTRFADVPDDPSLRDALSARPADELFDELRRVDPQSAQRLHVHDIKRVVRALEVFRLTGKPIGQWNLESHRDSVPLPAVQIGLFFENRAELYSRIERRVDQMVDRGLADEVRTLLQIDGFTDSTAAAAIGYREMIEYLSGRLSLEQAVELIKRNTRRYAKRQMTWFRRNEQIHWLRADQPLAVLFNQTLDIINGETV